MSARRPLVYRLLHGPATMLVARLVLGGIYVWYGAHKVAAPVDFLKALRGYRFFPPSQPQWMNLTVVVLPWVEILCGLLLLLGMWLRPAGLLLLLLTAAFTAAVTARAVDEAQALALPLCAVRFDCGCGVGVVAFCAKLPENLALCLLALVVACSRSRVLALEGPLRPRTAAGSR